MTCTVLQAGVLLPIARDITPEAALKLCDSLWQPGRVFFIRGPGLEVTVGSVPDPDGMVCQRRELDR